MKHRAAGVIGAVGLLPIAWGLVQHTMSIPEAAKRAAMVLVALWVVETILVPLLRPMLQPRPEAQAGATEAAPEITGGA